MLDGWVQKGVKKQMILLAFFGPPLCICMIQLFWKGKKRNQKAVSADRSSGAASPPPKQEGRRSLVQTKLVCNLLGKYFSTLCMYGIIKRTFEDALSGTENTE